MIQGFFINDDNISTDIFNIYYKNLYFLVSIFIINVFPCVTYMSVNTANIYV